jgi:hypothetical protein
MAMGRCYLLPVIGGGLVDGMIQVPAHFALAMNPGFWTNNLGGNGSSTTLG